MQEKLVTFALAHGKGDAGAVAYGTAGFRTLAVHLDHVMFRMGVLAAIRAANTKAAIGVMITASHNPACDNGVKLVDPLGEMLEASWESVATDLANVEDKDLQQHVDDICSQFDVSSKDLSAARVVVGHDTRPSSIGLSKAVKDGITAVNAVIEDIGLVSTPQLHYIVRCMNTNGGYGVPDEQGYYDKLATAYSKLKATFGELVCYKPQLLFDGANGVGAVKVVQLLSSLPKDSFRLTLVNDGTKENDILNKGCGADFVKTTQSAPKNSSTVPGMRQVAVDGDADRIVYFFVDSKGTFNLLDGDKISSLVSNFLQDLLRKAGLDGIQIGAVQTAYANGSSTLYMTSQLGLQVACVPTGVKHLHHRALQFDVGVYFEANGHGTVVFSENAASAIDQRCSDQSATLSQNKAANQLKHVMDLINQTVGDALSDMLLVEVALMYFDWDCNKWNESYKDFPNRLMKCQVPDRAAVKTTDAERRVVAPEGLQTKIDELVRKFPASSRAFVRPSGTEDVVRVFAEAPSSQGDADALANAVVKAIQETFA